MRSQKFTFSVKAVPQLTLIALLLAASSFVSGAGATAKPVQAAEADDVYPGPATVATAVAGSVSRSTDPCDFFLVELPARCQLHVTAVTSATAAPFAPYLAVWDVSAVPPAGFVPTHAPDWCGPGAGLEVLHSGGTTTETCSVQLSSAGGAGDYGLAWRILDQPTVSQKLSSTVVSYNQTASITGVVSDLRKGTSAAFQRVVLWTWRPGSAWRVAKATTTTARGAYRFEVRPSLRTWYYAAVQGSSGLGFARAETTVSVYPRALVTRPSGPERIRRGTSFTTYGYLKPQHDPGNRLVRLMAQRYEYGRWVTRIDVWTYVSDYSWYSRYRASLRLPYSGRWRLQASHSSPQHAPSASSCRYLTVY